MIGDPVRHSLSPLLHNAAFEALGLDWIFVALEVPADQLEPAVAGVRALGLDGLSVTMPHKTAIVPLLDRLSSAAEELDAVNTVVRRDGELVGENTDGDGLLDALRQDSGFDPDGKRCVVVGGGGAARAVVLALARAGAAEVAVVARDAIQADAAARLAGPAGRTAPAAVVADADLVVNATPLGMSAGDGLPVDPLLLSPGQLVVDLVYHPAATPLVLAAKARGVAAVNGLGMLLHQAGHAFRLWTGEEAPMAVMSASALSILAHEPSQASTLKFRA